MTDALRMTDVERQRAIHALRESYAHGDLTGEELDEKLNALFAAQSSAELEELLPPSTASGVDLDTVERHLSTGERVEWVGRPDPAKHFTRGDVYLVPFSILWGGFAIFWEAIAIRGGGGFFALWGVPFVAMGLYLIFGRFIYKANRKRRTIYVVTDRRVMTIVRGRRGESVEATYLSAIPSISTSAVSNGRGSVELGPSSPASAWSANNGMEFFARGQAASAGVGFYDIEDPGAVADLIERLRDGELASARR